MNETMTPSPVVFLDRDGTINVERNYLSDPDQVELLPNAAAGLRKMQELGFRLVVVTNQSAIGRGYFDQARLDAIHARLRELLANEGVSLDGIYVCPHTPDEACACRKPATGLVVQAVGDLGFDPSDGFVVGDKACDVQLGQAVGATTILTRTGYGSEEEQLEDAWPDFVVDDLAEAADLIGSIAGSSSRLRRHFLASVAAKRGVLARCETSILAAAEVIVSSLRSGGKLMICGNGGSAADAQHLAAEFVSLLNVRFPRPGMAALALTTDSSFLTAYSNDFDFAGVFERQVQALGRAGDVVLGISTSGNSENVVRGLQYGSEHGMATIGLTGGPGGAMGKLADVCIRVPSVKVQHIQEAHLAVEHVLTDLVERSLFSHDGTG